jgi:hypothetical protein
MTSPVPVNATGVGSNRTFGEQLDHVTFGSAIVGSSQTPERTFGINLGVSLHSATPSVVLFQPRQNQNQENNSRSRVTYEAYVVSRTSTRPQVDSARAAHQRDSALAVTAARGECHSRPVAPCTLSLN